VSLWFHFRLYSIFLHHFKSKTYAFDYELFNGDILWTLSHVTHVILRGLCFWQTSQFLKVHFQRLLFILLPYPCSPPYSPFSWLRNFQATCAIVCSRLDYVNSILTGISSRNIYRPQRLHGSRTNTTSALNSLNWLPIQQRINFKLVHRSLHNTGPQYLSSSIHPYPSRLGSASLNLLSQPRINITLASRLWFSTCWPLSLAFPPTSSQIYWLLHCHWNSLPKDLRHPLSQTSSTNLSHTTNDQLLALSHLSFTPNLRLISSSNNSRLSLLAPFHSRFSGSLNLALFSFHITIILSLDHSYHIITFHLLYGLLFFNSVWE